MEEKTPENRSTDAEDIEPAPEETAAEDQETEQLSEEELRSVLEVLLLVSDRPLPIAKMREVVGGVGAKVIRETVALIDERLREHEFPYQIREVGGGYVLSTKPEYAPWIRKLYSPKTKTAKLSQPALETLAVVASKQQA